MEFFIADTHFGDARIMAYENRPFASPAEMDEALIANWNKTVGDDDTVFLLGDFSCYDEEKNREILARLHGRKILILGNHDRQFTAQQWRAMGFDEASEWPIVYKDFFILSHEPLYINTNMPYANLFGHVHANPSYKDSSKQSVCVSVERIGYTPITLDEVMRKINS